MSYSMRLKVSEFNSIVGFHEGRGYAADLSRHVSEIQEDGDDVILLFTESDAWEFMRQAEDDGCDFGACMSDELLAKFLHLFDCIV